MHVIIGWTLSFLLQAHLATAVSPDTPRDGLFALPTPAHKRLPLLLLSTLYLDVSLTPFHSCL